MDDKEKTNITISISSGGKKEVIAQSGPVIKVQGREIKQSQAVDLVFVIDTTGSMSDKIQGLLSTCAKFIDEFASMNLNARLAVVAFGDLTVPGDTVEHSDFTDNIDKIKKYLKEIPRNGGGGNEGESSLEALTHALKLRFRENAVKTLILITDEPALQHKIKATDMINRLKQGEFLTFVISTPMKYFQEMAKSNGGKWYQISSKTDFTDLLDMFKQVAQKVSKVVSDVYKLGDGSVANYLQLKAPDD